MIDQAGAVALAERLTRIEVNMERVGDEVGQLRGTLAGMLAELKGAVEGQETRVRAVEMAVGQQKICLAVIKGDVRVLKLRSMVWDGLNSVAAVVAGLVGMARGGGP